MHYSNETLIKVAHHLLKYDQNRFNCILNAVNRQNAVPVVERIRKIGLDSAVIILAGQYKRKVDAIKMVRAAIRDNDDRPIDLKTAKDAVEMILEGEPPYGAGFNQG